MTELANLAKEGISMKAVMWDPSGTFLPLITQMRKSNLMVTVIKMESDFEGNYVKFLLSYSIIWMW
jgi:hypothetical protein